MRAALLALIFTTTFGCASKAEQTDKPPSTAPTTKDEPPRTADQQMQDKLTEAESARGEAKVIAQNEKESADAELAKTHKGIHDKLQSAFDAADRRFNAVKEKVGKATGAQKQKATTTMAAIVKHEASVMANIAKLRDLADPNWDAAKTEVETSMAALDKSIGELEITLQ
jgi:hypothetical protein